MNLIISFQVFQRAPNLTLAAVIQKRKKEYKVILRAKKLANSQNKWLAMIKAANAKDSREFWKLDTAQ